MTDVPQEEKQLSQEKAVSSFIDGILEKKNLPGIKSDQVLHYVRQDMTEKLLDQIDRALIEALPEDRAVEFDKLLDQEGVTPEVVQRFIVDAGVDVAKVTALTMLQFKELYLGGVDRQGL